MSDINKKPEKLASALYLITGFFSDSEPLKWKFRTLASELVTLGLYLKDNFSRDREQASLETRSIVLEIISLLGVAKNAGLVSSMNHELIHKEFFKYMNSLDFPVGISEENDQIMLSSGFFGSDTGELKTGDMNTEIIQKDKIQNEPNRTIQPGCISRPDSVFDKGHRIAEGYLPAVSSYRPENQMKEQKTRSLKDFGAVSVKKNNRQSVIIGLLKRKKEIMIKDVSPLINNCSEKTIQRELISMVKSGVLKKKGEKRWSRYSLA
ncbi:MAG: hypothetical protein ABIF06_01455 [bacterium]